MKLGKPQYQASDKLYICEIKDGFRCESERTDEKQYVPALDSFLANKRDVLVDEIFQMTQGWFSKPLQKEWLAQHLLLQIPTDSISDTFEGKIVWEATKLVISKELFAIHLNIIEQIKAEKIMIDFTEQEDTSTSNIQFNDAEPLVIGPTRRALMKKKVLEERAKAARALFRAERYTQVYCEEFGDDTDWESDTDSETESELDEQFAGGSKK